jgi:hypothetical protein
MGIWRDIPGNLACTWRDAEAMVMVDGNALFNPKLEFYNIAAFMIMNFIENFLTRRKNG